MATVTFLVYSAWALSNYHLVPRAQYLGLQFLLLGIPLFFGLLTWIGYMAAEPYVRRIWPRLMVSWQRLLSGGFRDPLVGRDVLLGGMAGSAATAIALGVSALIGMSEANPVSPVFGQGFWPSVGYSVSQVTSACVTVLLDLALLSIMTGILRRRWLGVAATGLILTVLLTPGNALDFSLIVLFILLFLTVLTRVGLIAAVTYFIMTLTLGFSPPLELTQWYAGRAMIALLVPLALLVGGFYVSLGGQPTFGSAPREE